MSFYLVWDIHFLFAFFFYCFINSSDTLEVSPVKDFFDMEFNKCIEIKSKHFISHHG